MAIDYVDLFGRLGRIYAAQDAALAAEGTTLLAAVDSLAADYETSYRASWDMSSLYEGLLTYQTGLSGYVTNLSNLAGLVLVECVSNDKRQRDDTVATALEYLVRDMAAKGETVKASTASLAVTPDPNNAGDGVLIGDIRLPSGRTCEYAFPESVLARVELDSFTGNQTEGQEQLTLYGAQAVDAIAWDYPKGSGATATVRAASGLQDGSSTGNTLTNSSFDNWTVANTPDHWTIAVGTAGTHVLMDTAHPYDGTADMAIAGDGANLTSLKQEFGVDTAATLDPGASYCLNAWIRRVGAISGGVLRISLVDASGNVILDDSGNANSLLVTASGLTTSYVAHNAAFRTPRTLPARVFLRIDLTSALTNGTMVLIDRLALAPAGQLYDGGPAFAAFSGALPFVDGDSFFAAANVTYGKFQLAFDRNFGMRGLGLMLPSATGGAETIADYT